MASNVWSMGYGGGIAILVSIIVLHGQINSADGTKFHARTMLLKNRERRTAGCPPWKPFQCPEGICIPLKYLCDYNVDCPQSGYDENKRMCTAAVRPTVESTVEFLNHQIQIHGKDYFIKLFGTKAADTFAGMNGVAAAAVALTESPRLDDFASSVGMKRQEADHLRQILKKFAGNDKAGLKGMGLNEQEIESLQPVVEQLVDTGFLKTE